MCVHEYPLDGEPICIHCGHVPPDRLSYEDLLEENKQLKKENADLKDRLKLFTLSDEAFDF